MTNFSEFSDPDFEEGWGTPVETPTARDRQRAETRSAAWNQAADRVALDLTPTGDAPLGYRHAIADVVRLLRRMADEETSR
ncbi:hypothetical protein AB0K23_01320 [Streptomyces sp. NPDC049602]|uniref:hypothetical protein n=1 Tax=Streptomyces sp. NPDC049602 TaxID=3155504 RepID=UPI00341C71D4